MKQSSIKDVPSNTCVTADSCLGGLAIMTLALNANMNDNH